MDGWLCHQLGKDHLNMYLTQSTTYNYELGYQLDVLSLANISNYNQFTAYAGFIEQLQRIPKVWHQTWLSWKPNQPNLQTDRNESLACLSNLFSCVLQRVWWQDRRTTCCGSCQEHTCSYDAKGVPHFIQACCKTISQINQVSNCLWCISKANKNKVIYKRMPGSLKLVHHSKIVFGMCLQDNDRNHLLQQETYNKQLFISSSTKIIRMLWDFTGPKIKKHCRNRYFDSHIFDCHMIHIFWLLLSSFVLEFVFVFVLSNVTWSSISKISLKQYWITCKVYMMIIWLAEETMWGCCIAWEKERSFTNREWQDSYKTINKQEIYKVNNPCTLLEQTRGLP